jgi:hypothetical protein
MQMSSHPTAEAQEEMKALIALQRAENIRKTFGKLRKTLKPLRGGTLSTVEVPQDLADAMAKHGQFSSPIVCKDGETKEIIQRVIQNKRTAMEEWTTVIDQSTLESAILLYCSQHFQQAKPTPFGSGQLFELLGTSGLTATGTDILEGKWIASHPEIETPELKAFIANLATPAPLRNVPSLSTEISINDYKHAINHWNERTNTSPSGRHLGFYKAAQALPTVQSDMCTMLNIVIRCGIVPQRWCKAVSVLIEKDPGRPSINRLRVIHLFEADYNLFLKVLWAQRLIKRGEKFNQFGEAQQGSRKGRSATNAVLLKRMTYDLTRIQRSNLGTFDNDAKSCYDRIVNSVAMLASQRLGMPSSAIKTHAGVLATMQYTIKTTFGVSTRYIQSTPGIELHM